MLSDIAVRGLKPSAKPYKRADALGLYLLMQPTGAKLWRLNYSFAGKQRTLALGAYPVVTLAEAREGRDAAKKLLRQGVDPAAARQEQKAAERKAAATFESIGADWHKTKVVNEGKAASTVYRAQWLLDKLNATIGHRPIGEIEAPELLAVLRRIQAQEKFETVKRLRETASSVFRFGIACDLCARDPAADLKGALTTGKAKPRAAIIDPAEVGQLLRAIDSVEKPNLRLPLQLLALTFVRPGELCAAEWSEFNLDDGTWSIPAAKMKMRDDFRVPLSKQALAILRELRATAGNSKFVFPTKHGNEAIRTDKLLYTLRGLGYGVDDASLHGFRSTASSILNESSKFSIDAIELSLAHKIPGVRGIYLRAQYWPERVKLMQWYADRLDELRDRGEIVRLPKRHRPNAGA